LVAAHQTQVERREALDLQARARRAEVLVGARAHLGGGRGAGAAHPRAPRPPGAAGSGGEAAPATPGRPGGSARASDAFSRAIASTVPRPGPPRWARPAFVINPASGPAAPGGGAVAPTP